MILSLEKFKCIKPLSDCEHCLLIPKDTLIAEAVFKINNCDVIAMRLEVQGDIRLRRAADSDDGEWFENTRDLPADIVRELKNSNYDYVVSDNDSWFELFFKITNSATGSVVADESEVYEESFWDMTEDAFKDSLYDYARYLTEYYHLG